MSEERIPFEYVLKGDGSGYIYNCDIRRWLGQMKLPTEDVEKIKNSLYELTKKQAELGK